MSELPEHVRRNRAYWDGMANDWVESGRINWQQEEPHWGIWQIPESEVHLLPDVDGLDVIELGCGTGYVSAWLARRGARPVGIDNSPKQLETARAFQHEFGLEFPLMAARAPVAQRTARVGGTMPRLSVFLGATAILLAACGAQGSPSLSPTATPTGPTAKPVASTATPAAPTATPSPAPSTGTWSATGSLSTVRWSHTATLLADGKVLVAGGGEPGESLDSAELYDPSRGTWSATGSMTTGRSFYTSTVLADGKVLVAGGFAGPADYLDSAELYDPSTGTWGATGSMTTARTAHTATLLADGEVLVGGRRHRTGRIAALSGAVRPRHRDLRLPAA